MHLGPRIRNEVRTPHPGGNADDYQTKGVAGEAICKTMKTKGRQKVIWRTCRDEKEVMEADGEDFVAISQHLIAPTRLTVK